MRESGWNPIEPYGKSRGGSLYDMFVKQDVLKLHDRLRRILWEKQHDSESNGPVETQERRDNRWFHNRNRRSYEDNA